MTRGAIIQLVYEFGPILVFFVAGQLVSFREAVLLLLWSTIASIGLAWWYHRHVPIIPLASGALTLVMGTLTAYFHKPDAIILADTIWFWGLALAIIVGFFRQRHLLQYMFDKTFAMTPAGWRTLSWRWLVLLLLAGAANEYVRIFYTPEVWIDYRFSKIIVISLFAVYQFTLARQYRIQGESNAWGLRTNR